MVGRLGRGMAVQWLKGRTVLEFDNRLLKWAKFLEVSWGCLWGGCLSSRVD
jgi:hypothetical protein